MYDDVAFWLKIGGKGNSREIFVHARATLTTTQIFSVYAMLWWMKLFLLLCGPLLASNLQLHLIAAYFLPSSYDGLAALVDFIFAFEPSDPPWFIYTLVGIMVLLWVLPSSSRCTKDVAVQTSSDWDSLSSSLPLKVDATRAGGCYPNEIATMPSAEEMIATAERLRQDYHRRHDELLNAGDLESLAMLERHYGWVGFFNKLLQVAMGSCDCMDAFIQIWWCYIWLWLIRESHFGFMWHFAICFKFGCACEICTSFDAYL